MAHKHVPRTPPWCLDCAEPFPPLHLCSCGPPFLRCLPVSPASVSLHDAAQGPPPPVGLPTSHPSPRARSPSPSSLTDLPPGGQCLVSGTRSHKGRDPSYSALCPVASRTGAGIGMGFKRARMHQAPCRESQCLTVAVGAPAHLRRALSPPLGNRRIHKPSTQAAPHGSAPGAVCSLPRGVGSRVWSWPLDRLST